MRFSENEMTQALHGAAKFVLATQRDVRKGKQDVDVLWRDMDKMARFNLLNGLGDQVLPVLVALPDVPVEPGARATYTDAEVQQVVEATLGEGLGRLKRAVVVQGVVALVQAALAAVPLRSDPDTFTVPDDLGGL